MSHDTSIMTVAPLAVATADVDPRRTPVNGADSVSCSKKGSWLHVVSHLHPKYGGVSAVVPQLDAAIAGTKHYAVRLAAFCQTGEEFLPSPATDVIVNHLPLAPRAVSKSPMLSGTDDLTRWVNESAGIHIHGLWQRSTALTAKLARKAHKPYVVSAHGMLESWALANKRLKKRVYLALIEKANLQGAACLHALTRAEARDYRRLGLRNPIAIIPNGVHLPERQSSNEFLFEFPELTGKRLILFLGRIHFKKGLDILCQAWARLAAQWPDAHLVLAGPDFEGTLASVEAMVAQLGLADRVTFTGMLAGRAKWSALAASEFFVLPSYSEGLSVSILEAMGMAKPVLITENCNLPEAGEGGCGVVVKATVDALEAGLDGLLQQSPAARKDMGARGEQLIGTRYSWPVIGREMTALYQWIEGGSQPNHVEIDVVGGLR